MHAAHQIPGRIPALQEVLHTAFGFGQLDPEGRVEFPPQIPQDRGRQILRAHHRRRGQRDALQFIAGGSRDSHFSLRRVAILLDAERRHEARAEFAPVSVNRRQRGPGFVGAQQQQTVARSAFERSDQPLREPAIQRRCIGFVRHDEVTARSEIQGERHRVHAGNPSA